MWYFGTHVRFVSSETFFSQNPFFLHTFLTRQGEDSGIIMIDLAEILLAFEVRKEFFVSRDHVLLLENRMTFFRPSAVVC